MVMQNKVQHLLNITAEIEQLIDQALHILRNDEASLRGWYVGIEAALDSESGWAPLLLVDVARRNRQRCRTSATGRARCLRHIYSVTAGGSLKTAFDRFASAVSRQREAQLDVDEVKTVQALLGGPSHLGCAR